jgi:hypothetical protein
VWTVTARIADLAGVEDFLLAKATYNAAVRCPKERIRLRRATRVIAESDYP